MLMTRLFRAVRGALFLVVLLPLIPAFGIIVYSGLDARRTNVENSLQKARDTVADLSAQCGQMEADAHSLLLSLSRFGEVREKSSREIDALFLTLLDRSPLFSNLIFLDAGGAQVASGLPERKLTYADLPASDLARRERRFAFGGVRTWRGEPVLAFAAPVFYNKSEFVGVIDAGIRLQPSLNTLLEDILEAGDFILFYDPAGRAIFVHPDDGAPGAVEAAWARIRDSGLQEGEFSLPLEDGDERFFAYQTVSSVHTGSPLMTVTFSISSAAAYARTDARFQRELLLLCLAACLALGVVLVLGRRFVAAPVDALLQTARSLRLGDLSARPAVSSSEQEQESGTGKGKERSDLYGARSCPPGDAGAPATRPGFVGEMAQLAVTFGEMAASLRLRERELLQAKNASDADNRTKGEFLASMSHEIRTPMNAIIGLAYLALKSPLTERQHSYVSKIYTAANALQGIINDILDFSKIEAGELAIEHLPFFLEDVLDSVGMVVGQKAADRDLEILFRVDDRVPATLVGDPMRLTQVLTNIGSNAAKFTPQGEIVIACAPDDGSPLPSSVPGTDPQLPEAPGPGRICLRFSVSDTGIGIDDEQQDRLFEAFTQADGSTTRKFGGTGLGLTITKRLLELMRGAIAVSSIPGRGATFTFTACFGLPPAAPDSGEAPGENGQKPERILIVEDNPAALSLLRDMLARLRFRAEASASAEEAFALLLQAQRNGDPYHLVILDWRLPGMDGVEATKTILRSLGLAQPPRVIFAVSYGCGDIASSAEQAGAAAILYKPVSRSLLQAALAEALASLPEQPRDGVPPDTEPATQPATTQDASALVEKAGFLTGVRILVVEDNLINQQIAEEILLDAGAEVTLANNGKEALQHLEGRPDNFFALVLMDMQMPEMDGAEATRRIRSQERFRLLPVIAMTAHAMVEERQRCLELGMNAYIAKPIDVNLFFETIARWIPRASVSVPEADPPEDAKPGTPR
ncbi:MAG: response regulator [Desulfovibrio sp.]|jgi:signal transduction histidine kinase/CheY-like chemotaxis protein|nr:response regulator [Desulfovibrio sp.]